MLYSFTLIYFRTILFDLELQSIFKMAAKFTITLSILPVNQYYYRQKKLIKNKIKKCGGNIAYHNILEDNILYHGSIEK